MDWVHIMNEVAIWGIVGTLGGIVRLLFAIQKIQACVQRLNAKADLNAQWQGQHERQDAERFEHLHELIEAKGG